MDASNTSPEVIPGAELDGDETDRTRLLVDAADELLVEGGLEGLTVRAVLKRTGLARRAFYERFASKDDLVLAVFEAVLHAAAIHFGERIENETDPLQKLQTIVTGLVLGSLDEYDGIGDRRAAAMVHEHMRLAESRPAELQAAISPLISLIADQVTEGVSKGQLRDCDPFLQATLIYNLVAMTVHPELLMEEGGKPDTQRRHRLAEEIWEFCRRAIIA
jgi:AcrR family transcriptional regulator